MKYRIVLLAQIQMVRQILKEVLNTIIHVLYSSKATIKLDCSSKLRPSEHTVSMLFFHDLKIIVDTLKTKELFHTLTLLQQSLFAFS